MGSDGPATAGRQPRVELRLAGPFAVSRDGSELSWHDIGSRKSRLLLKLLAAARPAPLAADQIAEVLWERSPPAGADRNIASLVSRLRAVLGPDVIDGSRSGYRLGGESAVSVDLDVAARLCERAERQLAVAPAVALAAAGRASELLGAGTAFADDPYARWADAARDEQRELLRRSRLAGAEAAIAAGETTLAARYAEAAMAEDGLDEAAHRWYMRAAAAAGEPAQALAAYAALRQRLSAELGTDPAPPTRELHQTILREETGQPAGPDTAAASGSAAADRAGALAGRTAETAALRAAWSRAAGREASLVAIVGEAGIGKTTLAEFVAAEAAQDGATVLRTRCYETERSLFLQPIVEALTPVISRMPAASLRDLLGPHAAAAAGLLPAAAALLGPSPPDRGSMEMERRRAFDAVAALLRGLADSSPVLLVVDDLQYAGQSTVQLLHFLGRLLADVRLLTVVTVRTEQSAGILAALEPVATTIEVGPLDLLAVEQLAGAAGQAGLAADILRRTRGHTLFVVEVLRALGNDHTGVPDSLLSAVQVRVRRAGTAVDALLRAASVVGAALDPLVIGAMLGLPAPAALERCGQALAARLLVVSGRHYEFANDLIREALYETTPQPTRLAYHRRAADLMTGQPEALAEHAAACGELARAATAWLLAAEEAMRRFAAADAAQLASKAIEAAAASGNVQVAVRAQITRGQAREAAGSSDAAFADYTTGAELARGSGDRRQEMRALRELGGDVSVSAGLPVSYCESQLASGLQIAESLGDRASEADLLSRLAIVATNRLRLDAALDLSARAVVAARAAADEQAFAIGLDALKAARLCVGDLAGLRAVLTELGPLLRQRGDLFRLQWLEFESAFTDFAEAGWQQAEARMREAIATNARGGYPACAAWYIAHLGMLARLQGRDDDAIALGRSALEVAGLHEHHWWTAATAAMLGTSLAVTGAMSEARELYERGLAAAQKDGAEGYILRCLAPLAAVSGSAELLTQADDLLGQAASRPGAWMPGYESYLAVAQAWLQRREPDRCRAALAPLLTVARHGPWIPVLAESLSVDGLALAALGRSEQARSALVEASRLATAHSMPRVRAAATAALVSL